jgi:hypothetical protein
MVTFPEDTVWPPLVGTYGPTVDDGVYVMLAPPAVGEHTIRFTAAAPDGTWRLDITYHLTVKS